MKKMVLWTGIALLGFWSGCGKENIIGSKKTTVQTDTLILTYYDTVKIPVGKPDLILSGFVTGFAGQTTDSIQAGLTAVSSLNLKGLTVRFGKIALPYLPNQEVMELYRDFFWYWESFPMDASIFANIPAANYAALVPKIDSVFACTVIVPYYQSGTSTVLSRDTLVDAISLPVPVDTLYFSHDGGVVYDTIDFGEFYNGVSDTVYRIHLDRDLEVKWNQHGARWYAIEVTRQVMGFFGPESVGVPLDTFSTDTQLVIPQKYLAQPDSTQLGMAYTFLQVFVMSVNGPVPTQGDTLADWEGKGHLYGFTRWLGSAYPMADTAFGLKAKAWTGAPRKALSAPAPEDLLRRVLKRRLKG